MGFGRRVHARLGEPSSGSEQEAMLSVWALDLNSDRKMLWVPGGLEGGGAARTAEARPRETFAEQLSSQGPGRRAGSWAHVRR